MCEAHSELPPVRGRTNSQTSVQWASTVHVDNLSQGPSEAVPWSAIRERSPDPTEPEASILRHLTPGDREAAHATLLIMISVRIGANDAEARRGPPAVEGGRRELPS